MQLLPQDCWAVEYSRVNDGKIEEEYVLHIPGDCTIDKLNLDNFLTTFKDDIKDIPANISKDLMLIWIEGNLTASQIYNADTDGATGLIVSGNLTADNIVVGGQEIFVTGDLIVKECFWGDYNHGDLKVMGNTIAKVFFATDQYHYQYNKPHIKAEHFLIDDSEDFPFAIVEAVFIKEVLDDEDDVDLDDLYSWNVWIRRRAVLKHLENGKSIIKKEINILTEQQILEEELKNIPELFAPASFTDEKSFQQQEENFDKIIALIQDDEPEIYFSLDNLGVTVYVTKAHNRISDGRKIDTYIAIRKNDSVEIFIWKKQLNVSDELTEKKIPLIISYRNHNGDSPKNVFENKDLLTLIKAVWETIFAYTKRGLYYQQQLVKTVTADIIMKLLDLPIIQEKYNEYDNSEFSNGNYYYMMRRHGVNGFAGSLDIGKEIPSDDFDCRIYHFRLTEVENPTHVKLFYCSSQNGNTKDRYNHINNLSEVLVFDWHLYREALQWYPKIGTALQSENELFLDEKEAEKNDKENLPKKD